MLRRHEIGTDVKRSWWMDILSSRGHLAEDFIRANGRLVDEVMTREVVTIRRDTPLRDIVTLMETRKIKRLPVVENGQLVGIVSRADLLRALVRKLPQSPAASADDEQIRTAIFEQLSRQSWSANQYFQVRVCNGTVELSGTVFDEREKRAACILAENTPGVRAVQDNMDVVPCPHCSDRTGGLPAEHLNAAPRDTHQPTRFFLPHRKAPYVQRNHPQTTPSAFSGHSEHGCPAPALLLGRDTNFADS